jgi:PhzF family phenazine biosynthesis protein
LIEIFHTRVFGTSRHGGSPCPVVVDADRLTDGEMHALARKFGLDTAFIVHPLSKDADLRIRYFAPDHEMGVSGHATIAAVTVSRLGKIVEAESHQG